MLFFVLDIISRRAVLRPEIVMKRKARLNNPRRGREEAGQVLRLRVTKR